MCKRYVMDEIFVDKDTFWADELVILKKLSLLMKLVQSGRERIVVQIIEEEVTIAKEIKV